MRKLIKILLGIVVALVLLLVIAVVAASLFLDPNDYKDEITQLVKEKTGRTLTIGGDIELSFFPWIGVETSDVTLTNAPGFPKEYMLKVDHAGASVKLLPLLSKEVVLDTIILDSAVVHLAKNAQGKTNWDDLLPKGQQSSDAENAGAGLAGLVISGVQLEDSTITWTDMVSDTSYEATGIDLKTSEITFGEPFELRLGFDLTSPESGLDARVGLNTEATVGANFKSMQLADLSLTLDGQYGGNGPGEPVPLELELNGDATVDLAAGTAQISDLTLQAWNLTAKGQMQAANLNTELSYQGTLSVPEFSPEELLATLTGSAPETSDPAVLDAAGMELTFQGSADDVQINLKEAYLDDTHLQGAFGINNFATMAMVFDLNLDGINLDRYLPPQSASAQEQGQLATPGEAVAAGGAMIPVETLRGLNLNGKLHADSLTVADLTATDIDVTISAADARLRIHPLNAQFYSGTYQGDIRIDASGPQPVLSMNESIQGIQAGPLLEDVLGKTWLTGTGGLTLNTTANLSSPEAAKNSLSGTFDLKFENGAIFGINIPMRIRQAAAAFQEGTLNPGAKIEKTDFSALSVAADIKNGVFHIQPISLESPLLRVSGSGTVSLPKMHVDVTIKPVLVKTLEGQGGAALEKLTGVPIPLHISGPLLSPDIGLNLEAAVKEKAKGKVKELIREELGGELGGKLGGLLGAGDESAEPQDVPDQPKDAASGEATPKQETPKKEEASVEDQLKEGALNAIFGGDKEKEKKKEAAEPPPA